MTTDGVLENKKQIYKKIFLFFWSSTRRIPLGMSTSTSRSPLGMSMSTTRIPPWYEYEYKYNPLGMSTRPQLGVLTFELVPKLMPEYKNEYNFKRDEYNAGEYARICQNIITTMVPIVPKINKKINK